MIWTLCSTPPTTKGYYLAGSREWRKHVAELFWDGEQWWDDKHRTISLTPTHWAPMPTLPTI